MPPNWFRRNLGLSGWSGVGGAKRVRAFRTWWGENSRAGPVSARVRVCVEMLVAPLVKRAICAGGACVHLELLDVVDGREVGHGARLGLEDGDPVVDVLV